MRNHPSEPNSPRNAFLPKLFQTSVMLVINFVDYSLIQGAPAGHESAGTPIGHESGGLRLSAQKEELEGEFAVEREELEADYQKQVDEMYFFSYRCCMKKHGIKRDVPSIPPSEEEKLRCKPAQ
ncbi:hypothetical protein CK203_060372 [Vitis vinifera]|uniref:Uncharacterized protein n=1 Tax=Vitis vinifera TaxID=29760 RepID=A0A438FSF0_VITVI|nr:hypothetical protein CK203_060372 [Vitis vinifera]